LDEPDIEDVVVEGWGGRLTTEEEEKVANCSIELQR